MPKLTIEVSQITAMRLEALAAASDESVEELANESLDSLAGSFTTRRAIVKARRAEAKAEGGSYSLVDLGWLDGYAGQTVDELLLFEGTEGLTDILFALEQAIQEKIKTSGPGQMTGVERTVLSVLALQREVNNGGYDQYFLNSSRRYAPAAVNDLVRIGCPEIADITQRAIDALGLAQVNLPSIEAAMTREDVARDRTLERCNIAFYEQAKVLSSALFAYVKKHANGIKI